MKWTFTQKQISRQNEKLNLFSADKVSLKRVQHIENPFRYRVKQCREQGPL